MSDARPASARADATLPLNAQLPQTTLGVTSEGFQDALTTAIFGGGMLPPNPGGVEAAYRKQDKALRKAAAARKGQGKGGQDGTQAAAGGTSFKYLDPMGALERGSWGAETLLNECMRHADRSKEYILTAPPPPPSAPAHQSPTVLHQSFTARRLPAPDARQVVPLHGAAGRGGGRHRGAVDRRAFHAGATAAAVRCSAAGSACDLSVLCIQSGCLSTLGRGNSLGVQADAEQHQAHSPMLSASNDRPRPCHRHRR